VNQVEILKSLAASIKKGKYTTIGKPEKLVLVGHSLGSGISTATAADVPSIADGLILTGWSYNATGNNGNGFLETAQLRIANGVQKKWVKYDTVRCSCIET
jgi:alpha-beta hydrolase superfamily lysophospholipase